MQRSLRRSSSGGGNAGGAEQVGSTHILGVDEAMTKCLLAQAERESEDEAGAGGGVDPAVVAK